jgi:hypothetical protein
MKMVHRLPQYDLPDLPQYHFLKLRGGRGRHGLGEKGQRRKMLECWNKYKFRNLAIEGLRSAEARGKFSGAGKKQGR